MHDRIDYLGTIKSLYGGEPHRFAALVGCSLGLAGRRAKLGPSTSVQLRSFLLHFVGIDRVRLGAAAHLSMGLKGEAQRDACACVARLERAPRLAGLAGAAFAVASGTAEELSSTLKAVARAFELDEPDIVECARLLEAAGHGFEVLDGPPHDDDRRRATFRANGRDVHVAWRPYTVVEEAVTSYLPIHDEHMTPRESLPITEPLRRLAERFPWPEERPPNPFDRRGWFSQPHMHAFLRFLPLEPALILEVGSFLGASLRFMMEIRPGSFFIAMDPFRITQELTNGLRVYDFRDAFYANCWSYRDRLVTIPRESPEAFPVLEQLGVHPDVVYIDGLHNYAAVKRDARWSLALNPRALLIGDDYSDPESIACGLQDAVGELARETGRQLHVVEGHVWVLPP